MRLTFLAVSAGLLTGGAGAGIRAQQIPPPDYTFPAIVVTATRTPTAVDEVGSAVSIVSGDDLRERGAVTLLESLALLPGVAFSRSGEAAGTGGVMLRGGKPEHLLVLIDGIAVNDPISPGGSFDWGTMSADAIERIEVVRGPQSTLYGSEAIAGVVHVITRAPSTVFSPTLIVEAGSYQTVNATASLSGTIAGTGIGFELSRRQLGGISAADEGDGDDEPDAWTMWSGVLRVDRELGRGRFSASVRMSDSDFDIDDFGGPGGDDPNHIAWKKDLTASLTWQGRLADRWDHRVLIGGSRIHRGLRDLIDPGGGDQAAADGDYLGLRRTAEWHHTATPGDHLLAFGIALEEQQGRSRYESTSSWGSFSEVVPERDQSSAALYLQDQLSVAGTALTVGGRIDTWSDYGSHPTGRLAFSRRFGGVRLRASYGTGFRAPGLYQRYSPDFGNVDLEPERSTGWDAGLELPVAGRGRVMITRYRQQVEDLIDFVFDSETFQSSYRNLSRVRLSGWEGEARLALSGSAGLEAALTVMEAVDESTGDDLVRRPDHSFSFGGKWSPRPEVDLSLRLRRVGTRKDIDLSDPFSPLIVELEPVLLIDGEINWRFVERMVVRLKVRNLTDASPVWVWGYGNRGRAIQVGFVLGGRG